MKTNNEAARSRMASDPSQLVPNEKRSPNPTAATIGSVVSRPIYLHWWTTLPLYNGSEAFWPRASLWLVGAGLVTGALAALVGLIDFLTIRQVRKHTAGWVHFLGNVAALGLALVNLLLRLNDTAVAVLPWGIILSAATVALRTISSWYGGELVYQHMIGVTGHGGEQGRLGLTTNAEMLYRDTAGAGDRETASPSTESRRPPRA